MRLLLTLALSSLLFASQSAIAQGSDSVAARAQSYDDFFFPKGTPDNYLDTKVQRLIPGTRQMLTVLPGVLYRGGGPGGQRPLPLSALHALCEAGFSLAVYAYDTGYSDPGPVSCTNKITGKANNLTYIAGAATDPAFKKHFLSLVRNVAMNGGRGPVFVHCWNGYHASGELAAVALRQICGWDGETASAYWERHSGGFPLISRIAKFEPVSSLDVPDDVRAPLCQQGE